MSDERRVLVSCAGGFHSPYLASQLDRAGLLAIFATTYPKRYLLRRFGVPIDVQRLRSSYLQPAMQMASRVRLGSDPTWPFRLAHDVWSARRITERVGLFVGWSGSSLHGIRRAKRLGAIAIVVRGSAHIEEQAQILGNEYARFGVPFEIPRGLIDQELKEYDEADFIQTNSSFAKRSFLKRGIPEARLIVSPTGVDLKRFSPQPREDRVFRFVYAGVLSIQKGIHHLLRAFDELALPGAQLWLIGAPQPEIEPWLVRHAKGASVKLLGHRPQGQLPSLYSQCDVFVMPSVQEGLATVQAQAMACGLPLLCTTNTGGEDFLSQDGSEGVVVPAGDLEALKDAMSELYRQPARTRAMGERARERVSTGFSWDDYGKTITGKYRRILGAQDGACQ